MRVYFLEVFRLESLHQIGDFSAVFSDSAFLLFMLPMKNFFPVFAVQVEIIS